LLNLQLIFNFLVPYSFYVLGWVVTEEDLFQCIGATWKWMAMGMVEDMGTFSGCRLRRQQAVVAELFRTENQRRRRSDTLTQRQRTGAVGGHIVGFPQFPRLPRK